MKDKNQVLKKLLIAATAVFGILAVTVMFLFIPRVGKKPDDYQWLGEASFSADKIETLQKTVGEEFRILQLTDTQIDFPFKSKKTLKSVIDKLVADADPHLIVITGDIIAGVFTHFYIKDMVELFDSYGIPWAPVFGNHDRELNSNLYYQSKFYYKAKHCVFSEGPNNIQGVGNYIVNVVENERPIYSLFMMDSNGDRVYDIDGEKVKGYDYIYPNQIQWYRDNINGIKKLNEGNVVPSMAFFHIPLPQFKTAWELHKEGSSEVDYISGEAREGFGSPLEDSGFFDEMTSLGSTTHVLAGHEHINNFVVKYRGIYLSYGTKTGNFSSFHNDMNGGKLITIANDKSVSIKDCFVSL